MVLFQAHVTKHVPYKPNQPKPDLDLFGITEEEASATGTGYEEVTDENDQDDFPTDFSEHETLKSTTKPKPAHKPSTK